MTNPECRQRFADPETAARYPAPVSGPIAWQRRDGLWQAEIDLGELAADSILAPSLSLLNDWPYDFQFRLLDGEAVWPLPKVPSDPVVAAASGSDPAVQGKLDCWHIGRRLARARLSVSVAAPTVPESYLLTATARPITLPALPPPPSRRSQAPRPPAFSQMLENPRIAARICSPLSLAMLLAGARPQQRLAAGEHARLLELCRDPATGMYGMWPLAIRTASYYGHLGAVELLSDWELVLACLDAGMSVIASIRYRAGDLPGSPMPGTGGHLVVVHGVDADSVYVNDPAAPDHGSVSRRYPLTQFSEAWFRHRGAAYILLP